jgi:hypothetical protein
MSLMPPQPYPWVTDVTFKDNQIVLTVKIEGFNPGETIELSGYATQKSGAFAVFNDLQTVPEPNPGNKIFMYVTSLSSRDFVDGDAVTVVFRAARVWTTVLEEGEDGESGGYEKTGPPPELAEDGTSWSRRRAAAYPAPPPAGNDGHAAAGGEDNFQAK